MTGGFLRFGRGGGGRSGAGRHGFGYGRFDPLAILALRASRHQADLWPAQPPGHPPLSQSLDHAGPMCWTAEDAAIMLQAMAGYDPLDPACADVPAVDFTAKIGESVKGKTIGIVRHFYERTRSSLALREKAMEEAIAVFKSLGCVVKEITLPPLMDFAAVGLIIMSSGAYAIHEKGPESHT